MEIPLNLVDHMDNLKNPGDAIKVFNREKNILQLVMVCPRCGKISATAGNHVYNPDTRSYSPSIIHAPEPGGCGYHGWLTNGIFSDV